MRKLGPTLRAAVIAASAALLSACAASGVVVYQDDVALQYSPLTLGLIGSGRHDLPVQVHGNPFAVSDQALAAAVVRGLQGHASGIPVNFTTAPQSRYPRGDYRTILVFDAPRGVSQWDLCRADDLSAIPTAPAGAPVVRVFAAYCQAELPLSWTAAQVANVPGPDSPRFDGLLGQVALAMFPSRNPANDN